MKIDLSLKNELLYADCKITEVAGRLNLETPVSEAVDLIRRNIESILADVTDRAEVTLTGAMAAWSYLIVFRAVVHRFNCVWYDDGCSGAVLISQDDFESRWRRKMNREEFLEALEAKVERATDGWPDWKHQVLRNSFRTTNSIPRQVVVVKKESTTKHGPTSCGTKKIWSKHHSTDAIQVFWDEPSNDYRSWFAK